MCQTESPYDIDSVLYIPPWFSVIMALVFQLIDITGNWCIEEEKILGFSQKLMTAP